MPGNTIEINGSWRKYYVGDSKMEELLKWLDKNGELLNPDVKVNRSDIMLKEEDKYKQRRIKIEAEIKDSCFSSMQWNVDKFDMPCMKCYLFDMCWKASLLKMIDVITRKTQETTECNLHKCKRMLHFMRKYAKQ